ncbi:uncharacterized protein LOC6038322 isoform X1 [Culex quinquefasciatus]|uniref:uncharacterized protein LOC6038322 isoform X1 n=1 Tax=Culex quinquefasciatus TaxID=7176 RepID=UPI0018E373C3|nr:uncharacterized protein LOC6038322 isoform X1 [Culex quinquefasciatus]
MRKLPSLEVKDVLQIHETPQPLDGTCLTSAENNVTTVYRNANDNMAHSTREATLQTRRFIRRRRCHHPDGKGGRLAGVLSWALHLAAQDVWQIFPPTGPRMLPEFWRICNKPVVHGSTD